MANIDPKFNNPMFWEHYLSGRETGAIAPNIAADDFLNKGLGSIRLPTNTTLDIFVSHADPNTVDPFDQTVDKVFVQGGMPVALNDNWLFHMPTSVDFYYMREASLPYGVTFVGPDRDFHVDATRNGCVICVTVCTSGAVRRCNVHNH